MFKLPSCYAIIKIASRLTVFERGSCQLIQIRQLPLTDIHKTSLFPQTTTIKIQSNHFVEAIIWRLFLSMQSTVWTRV